MTRFRALPPNRYCVFDPDFSIFCSDGMPPLLLPPFLVLMKRVSPVPVFFCKLLTGITCGACASFSCADFRVFEELFSWEPTFSASPLLLIS